MKRATPFLDLRSKDRPHPTKESIHFCAHVTIEAAAAAGGGGDGDGK